MTDSRAKARLPLSWGYVSYDRRCWLLVAGCADLLTTKNRDQPPSLERVGSIDHYRASAPSKENATPTS